MTRSTHKFFLASFFCLSVCGVTAQANRELLKGDTLFLIGERPVELTDAKRSPTLPRIELPEIHSPVLNYSFSLRPRQVPAKIILPSALKMDKAQKPAYKSNYLRLGMGNYLTPLADLYIGIPGNEGLLGFRFNHLSSNGPSFADFSSNKGGLYGQKFYKKGNLEAGIDFEREGIAHYGYDPEKMVPASKKDIEQFYQLIGSRLGWESKPLGRSKSYYKVEGGYTHFRDKFKQQENDMNIGGLYAFNLKNHRLEIGAAYNFQQFDNDSTKLTRNFIHLTPTYLIRKKMWELHLGFVSTVIAEAGKSTDVKFFPKVEGTYRLDEDKLALFGGFTGGVIKNSFRNFAYANPFIAYNPDLSTSVNRFEFSGGLKGRLGANTGFTARMIYNRFNDMALFITDSMPERRFTIVHDDVQLTRLNVEINHQYSEKFRMAASFNLYRYKPNTYEHAWQLPNFDLKINGTYNIGDKLVFSADLFVTGKRYAYIQYSPDLSGKELKPFTDANIGAEYRWKKQISAFARINNLAAKRYQYWNNHPVYGLNALLGVTIGF
jgi:hypothetical protein